MTVKMYVDTRGYHYSDSAPHSPLDQQVPNVDVTYAGLLTTTPVDPATLRTSLFSAKQAAGLLKKTTGWLAGAATAALLLAAHHAHAEVAACFFQASAGALTPCIGVAPYVDPATTWQYSTGGTAITTNTSTVLQAAGAAGLRNYLVALTCDNSGTGVATELQVLDGTTVIWDGFIGAASATLNDPHLPVSFPIPLRGTAATSMSLKTVTNAASLWCSAQGYQAP